MNSEQLGKLRELRQRTGASMSDCLALLERFDGNLDRATDDFFGRPPPAEPRFVGFQNPFPLRLPWPQGTAIYDQLLSLSLRFDGTTVRLEAISQWSDEKRLVPYPVRCKACMQFEHQPKVMTPQDAFEDWIPEVREIYLRDQSESSHSTGDDPRIAGEDPFLFEEGDWNLHEFQRRGGVRVTDCGKGTLVSAGPACLGYVGGYATIYLISHQCECGALRTVHQWGHFYCDLSRIEIGAHGDWPDLPTLSSEPIELATWIEPKQ